MNLLLLALIGIAEAVVWLYRCRTASGTNPWASSLAALGVTVTRLLFVWAGASAVMADTPWWHALPAYAIPATCATFVAHQIMEKK
jgi:hypothetical protein